MTKSQSITTKEKSLEESILKEVSKLGGTTAGEDKVNQDAVKREAENMGKIKEQGKEEEENDAAARIKSENAGRLAFRPNAPFIIPEYLDKNPVQNQEEIDAIVTFLQGYRNKDNSEMVKQKQINSRDLLIKKYGDGFVEAKKGNQEQIFTALTWQRMGANNNQDGWRQLVKTPPEVESLKNISQWKKWL